MANTVIQHKRSTTATTVPASLAAGELAVNLVDRKLYTANATTVFELSGSSGGANTQVQFNDTGKANGSAAFTFDKGSNTVSVGNSTVNNQLTATSHKMANSTANITIVVPTTTQANGSHYLNGNGSWTVPAGGAGSPAGSNTWIQYNASGTFGANSLFTFDVASSRLHIGNTTANATANVTAVRLANSTSNIALTIPTTTQANGSHYLNGNGSWTVPAGGGGPGNTVFARQNWTANASVNSAFTVTAGYTVGQLDVYQNGVKLLVGSDVDASDGSTITLTSNAAIGDVIEIVGFSNAVILTAGGSDTHVQYNNGGVLGGEGNFYYDTAAKTIYVGNGYISTAVGATGFGSISIDTGRYYALLSPENFPTLFIGEASTGSNVAILTAELADNKPIALVGNANSNIESTIKNYNTGNNVSAEFVATADNGNATVNYVTFGINGNNYNQAAFNLGGGKDGYIYSSNGAMLIGSLSANDIIFHSNGSATTNEIARFKSAGGLDMISSNAVPATPNDGRATIYVANIAGRYMLSQVGNSGINYQAQPHLGRNRFAWWSVIDNTAAPVGEGMALANTGAYTARAVATGNVFLSTRRTGLVSNTTAGVNIESRGSRAVYYLGNAAGSGGFHFFARAGISAFHTGLVAYICLHTGTGAMGNTALSAIRTGVGFAKDSTANNWFFWSANATAANSINLGAGFPSNTVNSDIFEFFMFAKPNSSVITYRVTRVSDGNTVQGTCNTACVPAVNTLMAPKFSINNGANTVAGGLDIASFYIETDNSG